jgi:alpha-D-ribose 1-methylphosphonate 5-triphosphate synthase subunit PhnL
MADHVRVLTKLREDIAVQVEMTANAPATAYGGEKQRGEIERMYRDRVAALDAAIAALEAAGR